MGQADGGDRRDVAPTLQAGAYYEQGQPATPRDPQATDPQARARLVALSAELTGVP